MAVLLLFLTACSSGPTESFEERLEHIHALLGSGQEPEAERLARALLVDVEAEPDLSQLRVADVLDALGLALQGQRKMREPETWDLARRALAIREEYGSPRDPALAVSLQQIADLHLAAGEFDESKQTLERALAVLDETDAPDPSLVASCHTGIAIVHSIDGHYDEALQLCEKALEVHATRAPQDVLRVAETLNGLGLVLYEIGDYIGARAQLERSLALRKPVLPNKHGKIAESLNNLGNVLLEMGDHAEALENYRNVVEIREEVYGRRHLLVGRALQNRAAAEAYLGLLEQARGTCETALSILEDHGHLSSIAGCLDTYGTVLQKLGQYDEARAHYELSLALREKARTTDPYVVKSLERLTRLDYELGALESAQEHNQRALDLSVELLGDEHPLLARYSAMQAGILAEVGNRGPAFESALLAETARVSHLRAISRAFSEREALLYSESRFKGLDVLLRLVAADDDVPRATIQGCWDAVVRSRAVVLDAMVARSRDAALSNNPAVAPLLEQLRRASSRYGNLALRGSRGMDPQRYRALLDKARKDKEEAEGALRVASPSYKAQEGRAAIGYVDFAKHLPERSAVVAYVSYLVSERTEPSEAESKTNVDSPLFREVPHMAALILKAGHDTPHAVALGPEESIDRAVLEWSNEVALGLAVEGRDHAAAEAAYVRTGERLRRAIWDPLQSYVGDANLVFVVPEVSLYRVNFATLPDGTDGYLADAGTRFHYLSSERDLVPRTDEHPPGTGLLAVGGVDFDAPLVPTTRTPAITVATIAPKGPAPLKRGAPCTPFENFSFPPLPATDDEVHDVSATWDRRCRMAKGTGTTGSSATPASCEIVLLTGSEATDAAFKSAAPGKRFLHLATHGFFLDGQCNDVSIVKNTRGLRPTGPSPYEPAQRLADPLLLSGLAFSGANHMLAVEPGLDDGTLVAEEIAALDLHGVEWAVLSACETGIGKAVSGEGVLGLRRAFQVAGVRTLIMSLWPVGDAPTRTWMEALYTARWIDGLSSVDAVHQASMDVLEARRQRGKSCQACESCSTHPFYWASFVAAGDWR